MIVRILPLLLLLLVLSHLYVDRRFLRRLVGRVGRVLWWVPTLLMAVSAVLFSFGRDFAPEDMSWLNIYLFVFGVLFVPKVVFVVCSLVGLGVRMLLGKRQNWGNVVGLVLSTVVAVVVVYGSLAGVNRLCVRHVELGFASLPTSFDGYKIVLFSDAHVGTFSGGRQRLLRRVADSINAQRADVVVFAGDLQNLRPSEIYPVREVLSSLSGRDGVFSVLGNHDYSAYLRGDPAVLAANERETASRERQMGWVLLCNECRRVVRGGEHIVIAGEENGGLKDATRRADLGKTLEGVGEDEFVVLVQHDPSDWRRRILPERAVDLTLSGHTHGGQLSVFGLRPTQFFYDEDCGVYGEGRSRLCVTSGIGGLLAFRFGVWPEIVVITLKKDPKGSVVQ